MGKTWVRLAPGGPGRGYLLQLLVDGEAKYVVVARLVQKVQCFRAQVVAVAAHHPFGEQMPKPAA